MGRATDYSNCYIYHIIDSDKVVHYVGSTSNMNSRKSKHKYSCNTEHDRAYNLDIYKYIRDNGAWNAFEMVPIRKIENISNKTELCIEEQAEINKFTNLKNKLGSYLSHEDHLEKTRIWHKNNREKVLQHQRSWKLNNPEKVTEQRRKHREANREAINERQRQYYQKQKELKSDQ
jgi:hypothetical protein|tara:strand:+ start:53 stop:577 length:525 start_codon:yes stop_codon:yes gene_type:complete